MPLALTIEAMQCLTKMQVECNIMLHCLYDINMTRILLPQLRVFFNSIEFDGIELNILLKALTGQRKESLTR